MPAVPTDPLAELGGRLQTIAPADLKAWVDRLAPDSREVVERAYATVTEGGWRKSPMGIGIKLGMLQPMAHTRLLSEKFVDAAEGRSPRQIWNLPARYGKSMIASQLGPAWAADQDPTMKLALTSYGDSLAKENATAVRDLLVFHTDVFHVRLRKDRRRNDRFVTDEGGGLIAAGVGSGLTGFGANGIVVDDPLKNWQEAHSEAQRLHVWNWYRSVVRTRLEQNQRMRERNITPWIIVVQTRWHEEDLTGMLLADQEDGEQWELIRLPAIADGDDLLGRKVGEPLAPALFDLDAVLSRAQALGTYLTAGMEQQLPAPEEGTDIMRGWWRWYDDPPPRFDDMLTSWDMKLKDKEAGDFVVGQAWGRTGTDLWMLDTLRGQWNEPTTKAAIALMSVRHPEISRHVIENTGNGPEVLAELRRAQPGYAVSEQVRSLLGITDVELPAVNEVFRRGLQGLLPEHPKGDKRVRARTFTPLVEAGNVHLPLYRQWATAFVDETAIFPNGAHDDQVDAWSQAMKRLAHGPAKVATTERRIEKPAPSASSRIVSPIRRIGRPIG